MSLETGPSGMNRCVEPNQPGAAKVSGGSFLMVVMYGAGVSNARPGDSPSRERQPVAKATYAQAAINQCDRSRVPGPKGWLSGTEV